MIGFKYVTRRIKLEFDMSEDEANTLASMLQHPLVVDESSTETKVRKLIFETIRGPTVSEVSDNAR
jgi:hypothetical protein